MQTNNERKQTLRLSTGEILKLHTWLRKNKGLLCGNNDTPPISREEFVTLAANDLSLTGLSLNHIVTIVKEGELNIPELITRKSKRNREVERATVRFLATQLIEVIDAINMMLVTYKELSGFTYVMKVDMPRLKRITAKKNSAEDDSKNLENALEQEYNKRTGKITS